MVAVVGEAGMEALVCCDRVRMQGHDLGGQNEMLRILQALVDADLEVEVRRLDPGKAVFASVVKLPPFVAEEAADIAVELVGGRLYVQMSRLAHEILSRVAVTVRHMMVLLVAAELAHAPHTGSDDPALVFGLGNWRAFFDADKLKPAETEFNLGFVPEF